VAVSFIGGGIRSNRSHSLSVVDHSWVQSTSLKHVSLVQQDQRLHCLVYINHYTIDVVECVRVLVTKIVVFRIVMLT
jgi:hypothetical protein